MTILPSQLSQAFLRNDLLRRSSRIVLFLLVASGAFPGSRAFAAISQCFLDRATGSPTVLAIDGSVYCSATDGQGGYFLGGSFATIGGVSRFNAAHLRADGTVSPWAPNPNGPVTAIALIDTSVYLGGTFTAVGGLARTRLAAVDSDIGTPRDWIASANAQSASFARIGGRVFVGGGFTNINGVPRDHLAAFDAQSGALLPWVPVSGGEIYAFAVRDTELVAGGEGGLLALSPTTGQRTRLLPGPNAWVGALAIAGNDLYVGGGFTRIGGQDRVGIAAVDLADGSLSAWDPRGGSIRGAVVDGDYVFICGALAFPGGGYRSAVARLSRSTGRSDGWAAPYTVHEGLAVQVGEAGVFVNSDFHTLDLGAMPPPTPVSNYPEVDGAVFASATVGDTLYIGGAFHWLTAPAGSPVPYRARSNLAAIRISTGEVLDWNAGTNWIVRALVPYQDKLVVCGAFDGAFGGSTPYRSHNGIAVIHRTTGNVDPWNAAISFSPFSGFEGAFAADVVHDTLYVGGRFMMAGGQSRNGACAFDLRTGELAAWNPNIQSGRTVRGVVCAGPRVFLGGDMNTVGGAPRTGISSVDAVTGSVTEWNPDFVGSIYQMLRIDDRLYVAGSIGQVNGQSRGNGAAFSVNDGSLLPWDPRTRFDVQGMARLDPGILLGWWSSYQLTPALPSLGWFDQGTGADLHAPVVYASDRIWSLSAGGGQVFLGGAFDAINGSTAHGWFAGVPAPSVELEVPLPPVAWFRVAPILPNPNAGKFELAWELTEPGNLEIEVLDVMGRRVEHWKVMEPAGSHRLPVSLAPSTPPGLYLVRLRTPRGSRTIRFCLVH